MRMVLKIFYLVLIWGVVTAICLGASYVINGEDMQPGFGWAGLIFALWLSWRLLRWMFIRYKARSRAMHLANFEPAVVGESTSFWSKLATSWVKPGVDQRLHAVLRFLSSSRLARNQNPKYALPWFVVVGTPAADIEATLAAANVGKPSVDQSDFNSPDFETRWWLTNQAVLISTSTSLTSSAPQLDEWLRLLRLLRTQRPANPVNGFVVALSISELINRSADELAELGELYRKRIDEAMSLTGVKMPVYIQLTGAEQLPGMAVLIDLMSDAERDQFFGVLNRDGIGSDEFMGQFIDHVTETIQKRSLTYLLQHESAHSLIELPSTLRGYSSKLSAFVNGCFQVSAFQNTPDIRGICLSAQITTEDGYTKPAFVKVFLEQILAAENRLAGILPEAEQRQRQMRNGLFGGYLMVLALVLGLLGYSYVGHRNFVGDLREQYAGTLVERQDAFLNINIFYRLQTVINALDGRIWFPWITHNRFVADVKMNFVSRSDVALLVRLESDLKIKATEELLVGRDIKLMGQ
ncbi:MAG: type VI secretion system protein, partial [Reinekea forsetii]|nr:type VI secretion system protein [Reinekea forsetii]